MGPIATLVHQLQLKESYQLKQLQQELLTPVPFWVLGPSSVGVTIQMANWVIIPQLNHSHQSG